MKKISYLLVDFVMLSLIYFPARFLALPLLGFSNDEGAKADFAYEVIRGNHPLLIMESEFNGPLNAHFFPVFLVFGNSFFWMKFTQFFFGFLALWISYLIFYMLSNRKTALFACILTNFHPTFFTLTTGWTIAFNMFWAILPAFFTVIFFKTLDRKYFYLASFAWGLSIFMRLQNLFVLAPMLFYLLFYKKARKAALNPKTAMIGILLFIAGIFPYLLYNLHGFPTARVFIEMLSRGETAFGTGFDVLANFRVRISQMPEILGTGVSYLIGFTYAPAADLFFNSLFALSLIALAFSKRKKNLIMVLFLVIILFEHSFTTGALDRLHLAFIFPFYMFLISNSLFLIAEKKEIRAFMSKNMLPFILLASLVIFAKMMCALYSSGGQEYYSNVDRELSFTGRVIVPDETIGSKVNFNSQDSATVIPICTRILSWREYGEHDSCNQDVLLNSEAGDYIVIPSAAASETCFPSSNCLSAMGIFYSTTSDGSLNVSLAKVLRNRASKLAYFIYEVVDN